MPPTEAEQQTQSSLPSPILTAQVRLMKKVLGGVAKLGPKEAKDILTLYQDKITYTSNSDPKNNWECPVTTISGAKQVMQELTIHTSSGDERMFGFGSTTHAGVGALLGGVVGAAVMLKGVRSSGIDEWLPQLTQMGVKTDGFYANTGKGFAKRTLKMFLWALAFIVVIAIVLRVIGIITNK